SITDGQIYLSPQLVRKNQFPAVDLGVSVSRVGGKAQSPAFRDVAGNLRVTLSQFEELEEFARFGTRLDSDTRKRLARGAAVRAALRQPERDPMPAAEQLAVLLSALEGLLDGMDEMATDLAMEKIRCAVRRDAGTLLDLIASGRRVGAEDRNWIVAAARRALAESEHANGTVP
ncbi:MAG: F0F1 ATP synthase subunit alpha, partial [Pseudomonadales bacterium]|nr:F0F1 ATP synthase subunit alpha [Pseudomonadales bacterium]